MLRASPTTFAWKRRLESDTMYCCFLSSPNMVIGKSTEFWVKNPEERRAADSIRAKEKRPG